MFNQSNSINRTSGPRCTATLYGIVTKEFERWHIHRTILVHVSGPRNGSRWPVLGATEFNWNHNHWLASHNTRRCGRCTRIDVVYEFAGILQCGRTGGPSRDKDTVVGFHVCWVHCPGSRTSYFAGISLLLVFCQSKVCWWGWFVLCQCLQVVVHIRFI